MITPKVITAWIGLNGICLSSVSTPSLVDREVHRYLAALCLLLVVCLFGGSALGQNLLWAKRAGGMLGVEGESIAVDDLGNSYVTGYFAGTSTFGPGDANETHLTAVGNFDIFVAKYNSSGVLQWAKRAGGTEDDYPQGIAVDGLGNSYVTGSFAGTSTFGPGDANETHLTAAVALDFFVAKYNSSGVLQWAKRASGTNYEEGEGIGVDGSGNSYVTGIFNDTVTFGPGEANETILTTAGNWDIFVAKYNKSGVLQWAKRAGGTSADYGLGIAVDGLGNSLLTGSFASKATFGLGETNQTVLTSAGVYDIFVAKYDSKGALLGAKRAGGAGDDQALDIAVDGSRNIYVTGNFQETATFGPGETNQTVLTSAGGYDIFVAKYNSSGVLQWAKRAGGTSFDYGRGIAVNGLGNIYVTGYFLQTATFGSGETNQTVLTSAGGSDIFVAKYDSKGALMGAKRAGGTAGDQALDIVVDGSGNSYVTGFFENTAAFGPGEANETTLTAVGSYDIFIAKFLGSNKTPADFDGDGKTDITVYEASSGNWFYDGSTSDLGSHIAFGGTNFTPVPGDYDGDGVTDTAVYDTTNGNWFIAQTTAGFTVHPSFGGPGYIPVPGDYDGDGKVDIAVYETSSGNWFYVGSTSGFGYHLGFGGSNFIPVPADYDWDGVTDTAVYDTTNGNWFISQTTDGFTVHPSFGGAGFLPFPGDYDGDGKTDIAVYETSSGNWFYVGSTSGFGYHLAFGGANFTPVPGDYDGDGFTDTAVYDTTNGNWFISQTMNGFKVYPSFGGPGYVPVLPQVTILRALGLL